MKKRADCAGIPFPGLRALRARISKEASKPTSALSTLHCGGQETDAGSKRTGYVQGRMSAPIGGAAQHIVLTMYNCALPLLVPLFTLMLGLEHTDLDYTLFLPAHHSQPGSHRVGQPQPAKARVKQSLLLTWMQPQDKKCIYAECTLQCTFDLAQWRGSRRSIFGCILRLPLWHSGIGTGSSHHDAGIVCGRQRILPFGRHSV